MQFSLKEGKNREIRNMCAALGVQVNRLIRDSYGPFSLGDLALGECRQAEQSIVQEILERIEE